MSDGESAHSAAHDAAIHSRLKDLFNQQTEQFRNYLTVLEKQQAAIESGGGEAVLAYIEIAERIAADIIAVQRVIDPLETAAQASADAADDSAARKAALEDLKNQAAAQAEYNRNLLAGRMADIGDQIASLRNNPLAAAARRTLLAGTASLVDIEG